MLVSLPDSSCPNSLSCVMKQPKHFDILSPNSCYRNYSACLCLTTPVLTEEKVLRTLCCYTNSESSRHQVSENKGKTCVYFFN